MNDCDAAEKIASDGIDILIDLNGYTDGHRMQICALRPAPLQVRYLGFAGTTGASFFDYLIGDGIVIPRSAGRFYSEKFVHMPHSYQVNSYRHEADMSFSQTKKRKNDRKRITFCCFCANYKFEQELFKTWIRIIKRVSRSKLWLLSESRSVSRNLRQFAVSEGVDPDRLHFADKMSKPEHLERLQMADIALDTRVVNGAATTSDALWAGVPVVTVKGSHFASRMSASILTAVGLPELITDDLKQYEDLAVALATQPEKLNAIREKLEKNKLSEPLFDTRRFVRNLENAFEQMWAIYMAGDKPRHIHVQDRGPIPAI
jgi:protein O-GlcNAc transferase